MLKKILGIAIIAIMLFGSFGLAGCDKVATTAKDEKELVAVKKEEFVEIETDEMVKLINWRFTSGVRNNAIVLNHADENAEFECIAYKGQFCDSGITGRGANKITVKSGDTFHWCNTGIIEQAFISIIVKAKDNIIGYAVVEIRHQPKCSYIHNAKVLKAVIIPKVDNEYQNVSKEQIKGIINKIITEANR